MPEEVKISFASEEERAKAMEELPETADNIEKLREMRDAPIIAKQEDGGEKSTEKPVGQSTLVETEVSEYAGYKSLAEMRKAFDEQKALIERQQGFIREKLQQGPVEDPQTQAALERAQNAEKELEELKKTQAGAGGEKPKTVTEIANTQQELQRIDELLAELDATGEKDPDLTLEPEFRKKERELQRLQRKLLGDLNNLYVQAMDEVRSVKEESTRARQSADEYINTSKRNDQTRQQEEAKRRVIGEMDSLAKDPELKEYDVGVSYAKAEEDYVKYANDVALAYYGRPARNREERFTALDQLQLKNPELLSKLQIVGVKAEPTVAVQRYIELCDAMDYMEGWRKDPATGKSYRLTKYDPATNQNVPLIMPSLKDAIQKMRLDTGYYATREDTAYQQGAQNAVAASQRRDPSVKELNDGSTQGQIGNQQSMEWAMKIIEDESIEADAMKRYRLGDTTAFDEINKARAIIGMAPMSIDN